MPIDTSYLLGHDEQELRRLEQQAEMLAPATRTVLRLAGIEPGMRVLDLGCGAGDVTFEVAAMVGPDGSVIGVDRSADALRWADQRARTRGATNIDFRNDDVETMEIDGPVDAVVGRLVLLYAADPSGVLRRFADVVRPGGPLVAMEYEMTAAGTLPRSRFADRIVGWITEAFRRSGLDPLLGARLHGVFTAAGLPPDGVLGLQGYYPPGDPDGPRIAAETVRTLLPVIEATGVATAAEVDIDTLAQRLARHQIDNDLIFTPPTLVGAWAHVTG